MFYTLWALVLLLSKRLGDLLLEELADLSKGLVDLLLRHFLGTRDALTHRQADQIVEMRALLQRVDTDVVITSSPM